LQKKELKKEGAVEEGIAIRELRSEHSERGRQRGKHNLKKKKKKGGKKGGLATSSTINRREGGKWFYDEDKNILYERYFHGQGGFAKSWRETSGTVPGGESYPVTREGLADRGGCTGTLKI